MKKIFLLVFLSIVFLAGRAQSVDRQFVILEITTGTWCQYCPGAAMGADDCLENGDQIAVIENHNGDNYANNYSNARNNMYNVSGLPSSIFDGSLAYVGGSHTSSLFSTFHNKYLQRITVTSPVSIDMSATHDGLNYTVTVTLNKAGTYSGSNVRLLFAVTQSHIHQAWQGQTELNFVNRLMVPDADGTVVDFSSGNTQTVTLNFAMDPSWVLGNCEFVAFVQNMDTNQGNIPGSGSPALKKFEIYQGTKIPVTPLTADFNADPNIVHKNSSVLFNNLTTGGFVDVPVTYQWNFPGGVPDTSTLETPPPVTYSECGKYDVTLIVNKGGQIDTMTKTQYIQIGPYITITSTPSDTVCWYQNITLSAIAPNAVSYLWEPSGSTDPTLEVTSGEYGLGAHNFTCQVSDTSGCTLDKTISIFFDQCLGVPQKTTNTDVSIYPNPNHGSFTLDINTGTTGIVSLSVVNPVGITLFEENNISMNSKLQKNIDLGNIAPGIYYLTVNVDNNKIVKKIIVNQ
ncbi:MAG: Omp28-related outer membrane protein [Bacteroidota bacterium]|nr:Omp28-related outer membrane protein [Bacteroidota bacterium]